MQLSDKIARQSDKLIQTMKMHFPEFALPGFACSAMFFALAGALKSVSPEQAESIMGLDLLISTGSALSITAAASIFSKFFERDFKEIKNINRVSNETLAENVVLLSKQSDYKGLMHYVNQQIESMTPERKRDLIKGLDSIDIAEADAPYMIFLRDRTLEARHPELQASKSIAIESERSQGWNFMKM